MSILAPMIAAIGSVLAVLLTALTTVWIFNRGKKIERQHVNKAILGEIHRLIIDVIPKHKSWWEDCKKQKEEKLPLIPFTTPIYDAHAKNIGMLDERFVASAASFYGYIQFLNSLQKSREEYIKLGKLPNFVITYTFALDKALTTYENSFNQVLIEYGIAPEK